MVCFKPKQIETRNDMERPAGSGMY